MWIKVLPADPAKEVYFKEVSDDLTKAWDEIRRMVHGFPELVRTQTLVNTFGSDLMTGQPNVVMVVNEDGQSLKLPINDKASKYYPNDYDIKIRGDAVLTGWKFYAPPEEAGFDIWTMPLKWKIIYDMETALLEGGNDYERIHSKLDNLLLEAVDSDVRKMYEEAREQMDWRTA